MLLHRSMSIEDELIASIATIYIRTDIDQNTFQPLIRLEAKIRHEAIQDLRSLGKKDDEIRQIIVTRVDEALREFGKRPAPSGKE